MIRPVRPTLGLLFASAALAGALRSGDVLAQDRANPDASIHFRHGVEFYNEANYSAALVEFQRAYAIAPNGVTLYDIGEAQFELQDYAAALKTFQEFLAQYDDDTAHRPEVVSNIAVLRSRVGTLRVTSVPRGADVLVDDVPVGTTPLAQPVLVSVGRHKVVAALAGRASVVRSVDVAAEDELPVTLTFAAPVSAPPPPPIPERRPPRPGESAARAATAGWVTTGIFGVSALVFGGLGIAEEQSLEHEKRTYPASAQVFRHDANLTRIYAGIADGLGAAAVVAGGLSLYWTLSAAHARAATSAASVTFGPARLIFTAHF